MIRRRCEHLLIRDSLVESNPQKLIAPLRFSGRRVRHDVPPTSKYPGRRPAAAVLGQHAACGGAGKNDEEARVAEVAGGTKRHGLYGRRACTLASRQRQVASGIIACAGESAFPSTSRLYGAPGPELLPIPLCPPPPTLVLAASTVEPIAPAPLPPCMC